MFVVIEHGTRLLAHVNVTTHPSATWTLQQLRAVIGDADDHMYLMHDRDSIVARHLDDSIRAIGLAVLRSPFSSPKANAICERVIGTIRREWLPLGRAGWNICGAQRSSRSSRTARRLHEDHEGPSIRAQRLAPRLTASPAWCAPRWRPISGCAAVRSCRAVERPCARCRASPACRPRASRA
jgi:hypothetical protein